MHEKQKRREREKSSDPMNKALWRAPLLCPLVMVIGCIYGGSLGWALVGVAGSVALALNAWRVLALGGLCAGIVLFSEALRHREQDALERSLAYHHAVTLEGVVTRVLSHGCVVDTGWCGVRVALRGDMPWQAADVVRVTVEAAPETPPPVVGMFSREQWRRGQGICAQLTCLRSEKLGESIGWTRLARISSAVRAALSERLMPPDAKDDPRCQTLCALVLGEKSLADDDTMETFRRGGCLHAFAVSGLHVGLVALIVECLLRLCSVRPRVGRWVQLGVVGLYVLATGMAVPALRAYLMLAGVIFALILRRRAGLVNIWCFAALIILLYFPWQLYQGGFILSFAVYGAICAGVQLFFVGRARWFGPDPYLPALLHSRWDRMLISADAALRGVVIVSICAWLISLPLSISLFHVVNPSSYLTNIAISPLLPLVMLFGLLTLALGWAPLLGAACHWLAVQCAGLLLAVVGFTSSYPGAFLPAAPAASPDAALVICLSYGKSFAVLGNPGLLLGDVQRVSDARYSVEPALFHSGFSPAALLGSAGEAAPIYARSWPGMRTLPSVRGVYRFTTAAGRFSLYFPPEEHAPNSPKDAQPIVLWESKQGRRVLYIGNAPISALESLPPTPGSVDIILLGYNKHQPILEAAPLRRFGAGRIILLPNAAHLPWSEADTAPAVLRRLSQESAPVFSLP